MAKIYEIMAKAKQKEEGFIVHFSTYDTAVEDLTLEQIGELFVKMGRFHFYGEDVSSDDKGVRMVLKMVRPYMKKASERYKKAVENGYKGKEHGIKGGRPRKGETREEYDARRMERVRNLEEGAENPPKPLNKDIDTNTDRDIDKKKEIDIDRYKNTDVKKDKDKNNKINVNKNTNSLVNSNSVSTNQVSFSKSQNPVLDNTKFEEEPNQDNTSYQDSSFNSKIEEDYSKYGERPRQGEKQGSKESDFLRSITLEDDFDTPSTPPDERYRNYVGNIQDLIRLGGYDYDDMTDEEMVEVITEDVDSAIEQYRRRGRTQRFQDLVERAKQTYMRLHGCSEDDALSGIRWLYQKRQRDYEGANNG